MDLSDEVASLRSMDPSISGSRDSSSSSEEVKSCTICRTTKTPLWRGGPSGPKSLCNACGIKYSKKSRSVSGIKEGGKAIGDKVSKKQSKKEDEVVNGSDEGKKRLEVSLKLQMLGWGTKVILKQRSMMQKPRRRMRLLGEEEQAAALLMAMSSGVLYA